MDVTCPNCGTLFTPAEYVIEDVQPMKDGVTVTAAYYDGGQRVTTDRFNILALENDETGTPQPRPITPEMVEAEVQRRYYETRPARRPAPAGFGPLIGKRGRPPLISG